jgi:hypothetical protein
MMHISNIREKIERDPKQLVYLKIIRGLGYKIDVLMEIREERQLRTTLTFDFFWFNLL